ncbi:hypothetical protein NKDENANG_00944 [Candidatus Entotheonellaceae bacterium PAL068K]
MLPDGTPDSDTLTNAASVTAYLDDLKRHVLGNTVVHHQTIRVPFRFA